jgi:hypothetical protein
LVTIQIIIRNSDICSYLTYALVSIMPLFTLQYHNKARICVIGDMMLNHINGSCNRISTAAPGQVIDVKGRLHLDGKRGQQ